MGSSAGTIPDPFRHGTYTYDSEAERTVLAVLRASPSVVRIQEQVKVGYELDGVERVHFLDHVVTHRGGKRIAYFVKAREEERVKAEAVLKAICARHGSRVADDYRFVSFEGLDPVTVLNAKLIAQCADALDAAARDAVRAVLPGLAREVTADEIARETGLGERAVSAAYALIPTGVLVNRTSRPLQGDAPLTNLLCARPANQAA